MKKARKKQQCFVMRGSQCAAFQRKIIDNLVENGIRPFVVGRKKTGSLQAVQMGQPEDFFFHFSYKKFRIFCRSGHWMRINCRSGFGEDVDAAAFLFVKLMPIINRFFQRQWGGINFAVTTLISVFSRQGTVARTLTFLLYAPSEEPDYENDWLLDFQLYSRSFRADRESSG